MRCPRTFERAAELKEEFLATSRHADPPLVGRTLALLFQKPSLRTRVTFEAGMNQLGGHAVYLTEDTIMGARESVHDVARNLERFVDAIVARTGPHAVVAELAEQASIPVINGVDAPRASLSGARRHVHVGSGSVGLRASCWRSSAMATTFTTPWRSWAPCSGWRSVWPTRPATRQPGHRARSGPRGQFGGRLEFASDPLAAVRGADVVYTDAWTSMGQEAETRSAATRSAAFASTHGAAQAAGPETVAMHCLPAALVEILKESWTAPAASSGTSPRTGSTSRRPCWSR